MAVVSLKESLLLIDLQRCKILPGFQTFKYLKISWSDDGALETESGEYIKQD